VFDDAEPATTYAAVPMTLDPESGVWSVTGASGWKGKYYLYDVEVYVDSTGQVEHNVVTDPYSVSLSANSARSQIVDLSDAALAPPGWDGVDKPPLAQPEDLSLYELHVRDFSWTDETVPAALRGTYAAFTQDDSDGMRHLAALADAGLKAVHLLPTFDIATIEERRELQQQPAGDLSSYPPDGEQQQAAVEAVKDVDGYNWGYDPWHYTTPEGSYATDPDGTTRIVEYREMVEALNETGLRVVMDVVYNHTSASGQDPKSVLDKVVPGYYHRLDADGDIETSTCCQNTATEHRMMEKLMVDSVVTWAKQYKVDGFRFDLMGHHSKANMLAVRAALDALTLAEDGVDGTSIYLYGEGWNFGEVQNNARFVQATQLNMAGTGIGTFNDRLRDAVRGGGPFDTDPRLQGFATGLSYDPNGADQGDDPHAKLLLEQDRIRVGLTGNLRDYEFEGMDGTIITGADVDYNGSPAGYTDDPQEAITYVDAHDNETLFDALQYKLPTDTTMAERVRAQVVALSTVELGQGVPFIQAGTELLRSKSLDRNSFNSGDWFNTLDFGYDDNNWGVGLPPATDNSSKYDFMRPLLADPALDPQSEDIQAALAGFEDLLQIRASSPLFRLGDADLVQDRLAFYNTGPDQLEGLIVMSLDDTTGADLDPEFDRIVTLFNANDEPMSFPIADYTGMLFWLHPVQMSSTDEVVQLASFDPGTGTFAVPARTTAVFVQMQDVPACTVLGSAGSDRLSGTKNADVICGLDGDDRINAQGGDDVIYAGAGDDDIIAGPGDDSVDGGPGVDTCNGGPGQNTLDNCERGPNGPKNPHTATLPTRGRS
jgi:pullulanase-type alpha-1,6-glucosidase